MKLFSVYGSVIGEWDVISQKGCVTYAIRDGADLREANLSGADLREVNLSGATGFCPPMVLLAQWGSVSDTLCIELMRYDAANHPDPAAFDVWSAGGKCPYSDTSITRSCLFIEQRELWSPGPAKSAYELMNMLIAEKCTARTK